MITVFINQRLLMILLLTICGWQTTIAQSNVLQGYIDSALNNNLVVQQKSVSLEKAQTALAIAKGWYYPTVNFQAGYQTAGGGRSINLPLGDLLNGVYSTLNQLTSSSAFPQLKNQEVNFLPSNFYDVKVRTTVPIINPDLRYNKEIAAQQIQLSDYELEIYRRDLIQQVKTAYFQYLSSLRAVEIYKAALELAQESRRVNQKLLDNGKGLPAYVLRADSEMEQVKAQVAAAEQQARNAQLYFNFLLNRDGASTIENNYDEQSAITQVKEQQTHQPESGMREELKAMTQVVSIRQTLVKMNKSVYQPRLSGFLDLGSQAENFAFNSQSRYYMAGLQLEIPLFAGYRNRNKIRNASLDLQSAEIDLTHTRLQLQLAAQVATNNLLAAWQTYDASNRQLEAAATYQRLIERGYREGTNSFIETVDARNQYTQAQLLQAVNRYKVMIAATDLERQTASYTFKK